MKTPRLINFAMAWLFLMAIDIFVMVVFKQSRLTAMDLLVMAFVIAWLFYREIAE